MNYIKFYLEKHEDFLLSPEGQVFLKEMATSDDTETVRGVAACHQSMADLLGFIAKRFVGSEENYKFEALEALEVLATVVDNENTEAETLEMVCTHVLKEISNYAECEDEYKVCVLVLQKIAVHHNTDEKILRKLLNHMTISFEEYVVLNEGISDELLIEIMEQTKSYDTKAAASGELLKRFKEFKKAQKSQEES